MITQPYVNLILPTAGGNIKPISNGKIYIGSEGSDPKLGGNPIYYRDNQGVEVEISSPIYLNATGVIVDGPNSSNIINPYTKKPISILILDRNGNEIFSELNDVRQDFDEKTARSIFVSYVDDVYAMLENPSSIGEIICTGSTIFRHKSGDGKNIVDYTPSSKFIGCVDLGFVVDGVTDNVPMLLKFKSLIGDLDFGIDFNQLGDAYFAGSRPDLSGIAIKAIDGFRLKVDANPNTKEMNLVTNVEIFNTSHKTSLVKSQNKENDILGFNSVIRHGVERPEALTFDDPSITLAAITGIDTLGPFTGTENSTYLSFNAFASGQQGALIKLQDGFLYEAAFRHVGTANSMDSSFRGVTCITDTERVDFAVYPGQAKAVRIVINKDGATTTSFDTPNGGAYSLASDGAIFMGVRVTAGYVEFYINGTMIDKYKLTSSATKVGFLTSFFEATKCQILNLTKTYISEPLSTNSKKLAIVGDSISYGAWASMSYDEIIKKTMQNTGVGSVELVNYAVSGSSTANWIQGGSIDITTKDFTDVDYCLVMLGTNDVQGGVNGITYEARLTSIVNYLKSINVNTIIGVFPMWTKSSVSGVTGVTTKNYEKGGWHRQIVRYLSSTLDVGFADVCAHLGDNINWLGDNVHPTERGLISVASAFSEAILAESAGGKLRVNSANNLEIGVLTLTDSWSSIDNNQVPSYKKFSERVSLMGPVTGGSDVSKISALPKSIRPEFKRSFVCACNNGGGNVGFAKVSVNPDGELNIDGASVTPTILWLDGITYEL